MDNTWLQYIVKRDDGYTATVWGYELPQYEGWNITGPLNQPKAASASAPAKKSAPAKQVKADNEKATEEAPAIKLPLEEIEAMKAKDLQQYAKQFGVKSFGRKAADLLEDIKDAGHYA